MQEGMVKRASELLADGTVVRVLGWKNGEFAYDPTPAVFESAEALSNFVYNDFCASNLSKYLVALSKKDGKTLVFLKPPNTGLIGKRFISSVFHVMVKSMKASCVQRVQKG